jgi:hypothetical protein
LKNKMEKQIDPDDLILDLKLIYNKIKENPELIKQEISKEENSTEEKDFNIYDKLNKIEKKLDELLRLNFYFS